MSPTFRFAPLLILVATIAVGWPPSVAVAAQASTRLDAQDAATVIKSHYRRFTFDLDIRRLAVGDTDILNAELISSREVLVLGRQTGRTTMIVWLSDGTSREVVVSVQRDLALLGRALATVDPSIVVESAPDRDALVLTGTVPDLAASMAAEAIARNYLGSSAGGGAAQPLMAASPNPAPDAAAVPRLEQKGGNATTSTGSVINLLRLGTLPESREQKIRDAIHAAGGADVNVRRVVKGSVADDAADTLVLEGTVRSQAVLTRVLLLAAQLFAGQTLSASDIRVLADEGGALTDQGQGQSQSQQTQLGGGSSSSMFGGARGSRLSNQVRTNLARATAVELAGGRVLSFIKVKDLPQVRVQIRLYEINRTKLKALGLDSAMATSDFRQPSLNPAQSATAIQGDQAARVGTRGPAIQNVLSFLSGGLMNELQFSGGHVAIDTALSLLVREGIAQTLSSPSLTVLSGEMAQVQVGGEVPVPVAFAPAFGTSTSSSSSSASGSSGGGQGTTGTSTPGVFSSVDFVPFGVQLQVRPMVGEDDTITLDVQPMVVTPDAVLTDAIRQSSGTAVATTAFQTRALRTSSRLQDGDALLLGGLVSLNSSTNVAANPGLRRIPIIGKLFETYNRNDQDTELIVVVNPVLLRTRAASVGLWSFVDNNEIVHAVADGLPHAADKKKH